MGSREFSSVAAVPCPALIHRDGIAEWGNQAFAERFGILPTPLKNLKLRELLWSLGVGDPLAGMIAGGATFEECQVPASGSKVSALYLRQMAFADRDATGRHLLWIAETTDSMAKVPIIS
ncbi:MAG TPA: hypothetical protein HPQ04_16040 [Rhodospirillaceae bacterium]|nr:hypothetical protein [Rhodospirillaceae bacterium]